MAYGAVSSIVKTIGECLINSIRRQLGYLLHYNKNIEDLTKQVESLEAERAGVQQRVEAAERNGEVILENVQTWLTSVSTITQESRNFFDEEPRVNARSFNGRCPNLKLRYQRSKEAKNKTTEADRLKRDGKFDTVSCPAPPPERISPDAEDFDSRKLVSKEIMEALKDDKINMIGVYGVGGVGKTTLVEAVRKQAKDGNLFDEVVMASVSQTLSIIKIQDEIADMLGLQLNAKSEKGRAGQLYARLEKCLTNASIGTKINESCRPKRVLVILDDIWEVVKLEDIGIPFGAKHKGCKIVLTSRRLDVCNQMHTQRNFSIEVLPEQEAWNLFCKTVGDSFDSPGLLALAVQVAKECAGLPIAIVTLANTLRDRSLSDWRDTAHQLSKSIPSERVFATLELSYNYLESEEAKSLFLLCCLFPEGSDIHIRDLWKYGMGLGLFQNVGTVDEARDRAVRLANDLKSSCLLLDCYIEEWVKVHDVVRDVGISIASRDKHVFLVRTGPGWKELPREDTFERYTAISLQSNDIHVLPDKLECPQLQILLLDFYHSSLQLSNNFFLRMENLKVLDMSAMCFSSLPSSLQHLKNLRTLCLNRCKLEDQSIIGELEKLEILSFLKSHMEELPKEIGNLSHLRLLDLTRCEKLTRIPPDVIRGLSQLEGLYMTDSFVKWEVERQGKERSNASLAELKHLHRLINLEIDVPDADLWPEDLRFENLSRFQVSIGGFNGDPSDNFLYSKSLRLKVDVSAPLKDGINELWKASEDLRLMEMKGLKYVLYDLDSRQSQPLRRLCVKKCDEMEYIFNASDWVSPVTFPVLEKLDLYRLPNLKGIWHGQLPSGCFCNLRVVKVFGCKGLKNLFSHSIAKDLSKLIELDVRMCKIMEQIFGNEKEEAAVGNMEFPHLRSLKLLRLPNLKNFCSKMKDDPNTDTKQLLFHKEVALPALEKLEIFNGGNFKEIWHPQFLAKSFSQLKSLHVASCKKVLNVIPFNLLPRLQGLERLFVTHCDSVEQIVEVGRLGAREGHVTRMLSQLRQIVLGKLPKLERMWWWDYPHGTFGFQNLTHIKIFECNILKSLFSPSIASSLVQLDQLKIDSCKTMETIIAEEREGEENRIELIVFPRLSDLILNDLPKLMVFYTGRYTLNFPSLEFLSIRGCPAMKTFSGRTPRPQIRETKDEALDESPKEGNLYISTQPLFNNEVTFPNLQILGIWGLDDLQDIWHLELPTESFCRLRVLMVRECHKLLNVVPSNLLKNLKNLDEVFVRNCDSVETIFEIEGLSAGARTLSHLTKLTLLELPKLSEIWSIEAPNESLISLQSLSSLDVSKCDSLTQLFSVSIAHGLAQLKEVDINFCKMMEALVVKDREGDLNPREIIQFPQLHTLKLQILPSLTSFHTGSCTLNWPSLKELLIIECPRMKSFTSKHSFLQNPQMNGDEFEEKPELANSCVPIRPLFDVRVALPTLEKLDIFNGGNFKEIWHPQFVAKSFSQLKSLHVASCKKVSNVIPFNLLPRLQGLERLFVTHCDSVEQIVEVGRLGTGEGHVTGMLSQLRQIVLGKLPKLERMWWWDYPHGTFGFQNLTHIKIFECNILKSLFSPSIASSLVQLYDLAIGSCEMMEMIIAEEREGEENHIELIAFPRLSILGLKDLPKLMVFYTGRYTLNFPSLELLFIQGCPGMKTFSSKTPRPQIRETKDEALDESPKEGNLYISTQPLFNNEVSFPTLQILGIGGLDNLKDIWHPQLPAESFCQLRELVVGECHKLLNVVPFNLVKGLKNLVEVFVKNCDSVKIIFEIEGLAAGTRTLSQLTKLKLWRLPKLSEIWSTKAPNESLISLQSLSWLDVYKCDSLTKIFSASIAHGLAQLKEVEIDSCEMMEAIVVKEREGDLNPTEIVLFPQLHTLKLQTLPSLTSFHTGSCTLNWSSLKELWIIECPRMKSFTSKHSFLQNPQMNDDEFEEKSELANSCVPIRPLFDVWVAFTNLEKLRILNMENLQELFHSLLPDESFCQLKRLEVKGCHKLSRVAPSNLLPRLKNLNELFVKECNLMKEIFEVEGLGGEGHISLFQLENMELCNLPDLRIFCSEKYSFELPLLKRLKLEGCPKMQTFFSGSINTPKLRRITVEDGEKRWEGSLNGTIEHLFQEKIKHDISSQQEVEEEEEEEEEEEGKVNKKSEEAGEVGVDIEREENGSAQAIRHEISELAEDKA